MRPVAHRYPTVPWTGAAPVPCAQLGLAAHRHPAAPSTAARTCLPRARPPGWFPHHAAHWQSGHRAGTSGSRASQHLAGQDGSQTPQQGRAWPQKIPALPETPQAAGLHPEHHPGLLSLAPTGCLGHHATCTMPWHRCSNCPSPGAPHHATAWLGHQSPVGAHHWPMGRAPTWHQLKPSWRRVLAGAQHHQGCPHSAVAVCDTPHDSPTQLSLTASTQCLQCLQFLRMDLCHVPVTREKGWYLALMAPNVKGPNYAWLDPSRLYCHPQGLQDCVTDLLQPFQGDAIDMVAGIDAMGFILGAAAAAVLQKGFLAIRKAGHLCVQTLAQPYTDYSGREKVMEVRTDAISLGLRILLVDQWVETGGTMRAAIQLVEQQGGVVAGVAAICIEDSEGGRWIQEHYKCAHCVPPHLQPRFNSHQLSWD